MNGKELEKKIIGIIASTGISRMKELKEIESMGVYTYKELLSSINYLEEKNILNREIVRLGGRGGHNFYVFELSEEGKKIALTLTGEKPVVSQKQILLKEHGKLEIAYLFEQCLPHLKEKGILLEKTEHSYFITMNGETHPILLDASKSYSKDEYLEIFDTMWEKSSTIYYLSTSHVVSSFLILDEIEAWLQTRNLSKEKQKTVQFKTSYMQRILDGKGEEWDILNNLWSESILRWSKVPSFFIATEDK